MKRMEPLKNNRGQSIMEYVIISSLIGIICLAAVKGFGEVLNRRINELKSKISQTIKV